MASLSFLQKKPWVRADQPVGAWGGFVEGTQKHRLGARAWLTEHTCDLGSLFSTGQPQFPHPVRGEGWMTLLLPALTLHFGWP